MAFRKNILLSSKEILLETAYLNKPEWNAQLGIRLTVFITDLRNCSY
jgi:hypothetical protein